MEQLKKQKITTCQSDEDKVIAVSQYSPTRKQVLLISNRKQTSSKVY